MTVNDGERVCMECGSTHRVSQYGYTGQYYCCKHWNQMNKHGKIMDEVFAQRRREMICSVCGVKGHEIIDGKRYCSKHAHHMRNHGKILTETRFDPNEIIVHKKEGYAEVVLKDHYFNVVALSKIDLEDLDYAKKYKWGYSPDGYMTTRKNGGTRRYHRLIMAAPKGKVVDHINGDPLDNRKDNLNVTTQKTNTRNRFDKATTASGHKGVYKHRDKWMVRISNKYGGVFETKQEAIDRRRELEHKLNYNYRRTGHNDD